MDKTSNRARKNLTSTMLHSKLEVLRRFKHDGIPLGYAVPTSMATFRAWQDDDLGLSTIGSPKSTNIKLSPHNALVIAQIEKLLRELSVEKIANKKRKEPTLSMQLQKAISERDAARYMAGKFLTKYCEQREKLIDTVNEVRSAKQKLEKANATNDELRRAVIKLGGSTLYLV